MRAKTIQILGTGSGVGKSVIVAGLCRMFLQDGFKVAPFKAQNMSLNSAVTPDGLEIGRAQAMQADACKIEPGVDMNPVLLKPISNVGSQVIVHGRAVGNMSAVRYYRYKSKIFNKVKQSLNKLMADNDIVVIEGAGSPAEINLKKHDIVNMKIAKLIKSPVFLIGDIDRGGVFAWLLGTIGLLPANEKKLIKGFIINKFRGDKQLLKDGLRFLERKSGKKVLGVVPYYTDIKIPEEDSLFFDQIKRTEKNRSGKIKIVVVKLPHISNFTDFDVFEREPGVYLEYSVNPEEIASADCIILPGTKNTSVDLEFIYNKGLDKVIKKKAAQGGCVAGICGGYQMLGRNIIDSSGVENKSRVKGLRMLDIDTNFRKIKKTFQVEGKDLSTGTVIKGYEIHHGQTHKFGKGRFLFLIRKRGGKNAGVKDGVSNYKGNVWGTYVHGIFDNFYFRRDFLNKLRKKKGLSINLSNDTFSQDREYDKLADLLRENFDMKFLKKVIDGKV